jgi:uncharacterized protein YbbC (DUF1343 family)
MRERLFFVFLMFAIAINGIAQRPIVGAERTWEYIPKLRNKHVGVVVNQTSVIGKTHLVDSLIKLNISIQYIFAPEHGFRGTADAGAHIDNSIDTKTKLPIISLYGAKHAPSDADLKEMEVLVFDIQDVGCRFYTFISTLHYVMEACAKNHVELIVLDRPNPNGMYVDGPMLQKGFQSFVGVDPIPVLYGMTIGEYGLMVKGEHWIADADSFKMTVVKCSNYTHKTKYALPVKPSPNLPNIQAIALYPSLCYFEGTNVSVGRGTNFPFQVVGSPYYDSVSALYSFVPKPKDGAREPFLLNKKCFGFDLRKSKATGVNLSFVIKMYKGFTDKSKFFLTNNFFDRLIGTDAIRKMIVNGKSEAEIRQTWQNDIVAFKIIRQKYLIYE